MLKVIAKNWLLLAVIVINTVARFLPDNVLFPFGNAYKRFAALFEGYWYHSFSKAANRFLFPGYAYYFADALCWLLVSLYVQQLARGYVQVLAVVFIGFTVNNFLDELVFNPYVFDWNEVLLIAGTILLAWYKYRELKVAVE